jgi:hypothetical protein
MALETDKSPNIDFVHPELRAVLTRYRMIADCLEGEEAVKRAGNGGDAYLIRPNLPNATNSRPSRVDGGDDDPMFDAAAVTEEQEERFRQLVARAVFYNVTQRTHRGLVGAVFKNEPAVTVPEFLPRIEEDCDGAGVPLAQQAEKAAGYALAFGRYGLLVDYPSLDEPATRAQVVSGDVSPTVVLYDPQAVINWRTIVVGASRILSLVVIRESVSVSDDGFQTEDEPRWRVLRLVQGEADGGLVYEVSMWKQGAKSPGRPCRPEYRPLPQQRRQRGAAAHVRPGHTHRLWADRGLGSGNPARRGPLGLARARPVASRWQRNASADAVNDGYRRGDERQGAPDGGARGKAGRAKASPAHGDRSGHRGRGRDFRAWLVCA